MPIIFRSCNVIAGCLMSLLVSCDMVSCSLPLFHTSATPALPSRPLDPAAQSEFTPLDSDSPVVPGFVDGSLESGFSSEESEDPKPLQPLYAWEEGGEDNGTMMDPESLEGYSPTSFQPSSSPVETPSELNSSSMVATVESLNPEMWDVQGESSGSPVGPIYSPSTTELVPLTRATTTDSDLGLVRHRAQGAGQGSASTASTTELEQAHDRFSSPSSVNFDGADLASRGPAGPEDSSREDSRTPDPAFVLSTVHQSGEENNLEGVMQLPRLTTASWSSSSSSSSSLPTTEVTPAVSEDVEPERKGRKRGRLGVHSESKPQDTQLPQESLQVVCVDWSDLTGKGYVILNMSENFDCDEFRLESGKRLLEMLENAFSRKMNSPQGSWSISLSKPTKQDRQLLMTVASEQGVIASKDVLAMLTEIRRGLSEIGIQNYTSVTSCQSRPSQTRSDYGKLFVVLVIIGSICVVIIASGLIYICWQRRLPKMKNMSRGEELHFVENGCHDNPTLDVASDGQSEMQEKKHSANGMMAGGGGGSGWQVLVNKSGKESAENMEEDTHL